MASSLVENYLINIKCKKQSHETQQIMYVCTIGTCKDRLGCTNCMLSTHQHHAKNLVNIKQFL